MKKVLSLCLAAALALSLAACKNEPESYPVEVVGPERTSAPVPTADPEASASPQPGWMVTPRTDIDIQKSLADYAKPQVTQLAQQDQLAFFLQNDKIGVIDLDGTVRIPAEKDVHWCGVCGITNSDESEIYEQDGTVVGSGGHGLASGTLLRFRFGSTLGRLRRRTQNPFDIFGIDRLLFEQQPFGFEQRIGVALDLRRFPAQVHSQPLHLFAVFGSGKLRQIRGERVLQRTEFRSLRWREQRCLREGVDQLEIIGFAYGSLVDFLTEIALQVDGL